MLAGSLSLYDVVIYLFCTELHYILMIWHSFLYHESSYVWDLVLPHTWWSSRPSLVPPKTRVWKVDDEMDDVIAPSSDAVPRTIRESLTLATTLRPPAWLWTVRCNRSGLRPSDGCAGASRPQRHMRPRRTASRSQTGSRQASSRRWWAMPTWAPTANGVYLGFPSKIHGFILGASLWKWLTS
jgi:hypothetical protein